MSEMKSLCGSEVRENAGSCYAELLALRFFRRAIRNYTSKKVDDDLFRPLVRNIFNEKCVYDLQTRLIGPGPKKVADSNTWMDMRHTSTQDVICNLWCNPSTRAACKSQVLEWTDAIIEEYEKLSAGDPLVARLDEIAKLMKLNADEMSVLEVLWLMSIEKLEEVRTAYTMSATSGCVALYTGLSEQQVRKSLVSSSRLARFGCVDLDSRCKVNSKIRYYLDGINEEPLVSSYYRKDDAETLPVEFFGKLAEDHLPLLKRMLSGEKGRKVNILLYGAPGTGKTSFARALAKATGRTAYQVQQRPKDRDGDFREARAEVRYAALEICDEQTDSDSSVIIVDEADALLRCNNLGISAMFGRESSTTGDKGLLNDILEKIETPTIWITNTCAEELDPSNRRRFDYAIKFEPLTREQRVQIWRNASKKAGVARLLADKDIERFSTDYPVNAGIVARALQNLKRVGAKKAEAASVLTRLLDRQCELSGTDRTQERVLEPAKGYSTEGLNIKTSIPLTKVEESVRRFLDASNRKADPDAPRMNILLTGAPGSGKTEFVKHLASTLGRPLLMRRASDLKSKWVGETEQNIAAAFREAREKRAILFFDEVDTFLDSRESVQQGHEKSMVNEVLQQMESFGGVFVGTTNFKDMLDPAVARRFTFKVELDYLDVEGRCVFWKRFFGSEPRGRIRSRLNGLDRLTPGDFRTVRQELYYLGDDVSDDDRLDALEAELSAKTGVARRIGFSE